jgi:hypothetical protein
MLNFTLIQRLQDALTLVYRVEAVVLSHPQLQALQSGQNQLFHLVSPILMRVAFSTNHMQLITLGLVHLLVLAVGVLEFVNFSQHHFVLLF